MGGLRAFDDSVEKEAQNVVGMIHKSIFPPESLPKFGWPYSLLHTKLSEPIQNYGPLASDQ